MFNVSPDPKTREDTAIMNTYEYTFLLVYRLIPKQQFQNMNSSPLPDALLKEVESLIQDRDRIDTILRKRIQILEEENQELNKQVKIQEEVQKGQDLLEEDLTAHVAAQNKQLQAQEEMINRLWAENKSLRECAH